MSTTITIGTWVVVNLPQSCACERPHTAPEDGLRGEVTGVHRSEEGIYFVLLRGRQRESRIEGNQLVGTPLGRDFHVSKLEVIPGPP
jgi:hypothetical protein